MLEAEITACIIGIIYCILTNEEVIKLYKQVYHKIKGKMSKKKELKIIYD